MKTYSIQELKWDTEFFGIKSAKIVLKENIEVKDLKEMKENIRNNNFKFITIQNNNNNENNNYLLKEFNNIFLADLNVQFIKKINQEKVSNTSDSNIEINNNLEYDENIIKIACTSFVYSRFLNDKNLKNGDKVYLEWTKNAFKKNDKYFITYRENKKTIGFLLFSIDYEDIVIELIAIDNEHKKKGIGKKLINSLEKYAVNNDKKAIRVGTQVNNINAQNFYEKCGFNHIYNNSIYHLWIK